MKANKGKEKKEMSQDLKNKLMKQERIIILDPAHAENVAGKRAPHGDYREYAWSRLILKQVYDNLKNEKIHVEWSVDPDVKDEIGLRNRVNNMNLITKPAFVFSLHSNAAPGGDYDWVEGARWPSIWTCLGQTKSDEFATIIYDQLKADLPEISQWRTDTWSDGDIDWESDFTVLMSRHASVLLEFLFHTSSRDVALLQDLSIQSKLVDSLTAVLKQIAYTK